MDPELPPEIVSPSLALCSPINGNEPPTWAMGPFYSTDHSCEEDGDTPPSDASPGPLLETWCCASSNPPRTHLGEPQPLISITG